MCDARGSSQETARGTRDASSRGRTGGGDGRAGTKRADLRGGTRENYGAQCVDGGVGYERCGRVCESAACADEEDAHMDSDPNLSSCRLVTTDRGSNIRPDRLA